MFAPTSKCYIVTIALNSVVRLSYAFGLDSTLDTGKTVCQLSNKRLSYRLNRNLSNLYGGILVATGYHQCSVNTAASLS